MSDCDFSAGTYFLTKADAVDALDSFLAQTSKGKRYVRSNDKYCAYACSDSRCSFYCSIRKQKCGRWKVATLEGTEHNPCSGFSKLSQKAVARRLADCGGNALLNSKAEELKQMLQDETKAVLSLDTIYHARKLVQGKALPWNRSFEYIADYVAKFKELNPTGYAEILLDLGGHFRGVCFVPELSATVATHFKTVLGLDMGHLRSDWRNGKVIKLVAQDWNKQNVEVAFGVADSESGEIYQWFLEQVLKHNIRNFLCLFAGKNKANLCSFSA